MTFLLSTFPICLVSSYEKLPDNVCQDWAEAAVLPSVRSHTFNDAPLTRSEAA